MADLRILVPESTVNYIKNPSARYDTTGWTSDLATLTRTLDHARFGVASLKVVTIGVVLHEGIYYRVSALAGISDPITASVYLMGTGQVRIRLIDNPFGGEWVSQSVDLRADRWTRVEVTGRCTGSDDVRLYVETTAVRAATFYVDGVQMERKPYATTYCDGDQEGCRWNIVAHNSHSIRDPYTRAGGRWVELAGTERQAEDLYMTVVGGMGLPPITNNLQSFADAPGSYYQNTKVLARPLTFTFHAKREQRRETCSPVTLQRLHELRSLLIDIIKPDKTAGGQEFTLEYRDGDTPLYLKARYDGGLEGEWDIRNQWTNSFPLRLLAVSPFFFEDDQQVAELDFQESPESNYITARVDGEWNNLNFGFNNVVQKLALGTRGEVIAVGYFTRANSDTEAIDPLIPANRIAYWDGEKWNQYGVGADNVIWTVAIAPNGYIYVAGVFTSIGGVAANRIAYWDGSNWNAMGAGMNANTYALAVAPNGDVYAGGGFTQAGGVPANFIARWDGSSWHSVGPTGGLNGTVQTIAISQDGRSLYAGGAFTDAYGNPGSGLTRVAKLDLETNTWEALGDGFTNGVCEILKISPSGILFAGGQFTVSGGQTLNGIGYWNGSSWLPLGQGMSGTITGSAATSIDSIDIRDNGELIASGDFDQAGDVEAEGVAVWNGSVWTNLDIVALEQIFPIQTAIYDQYGNIYLAADSPVRTCGKTQVTNTGSAEANPNVYILGPSTLKFIENYTSKRRVYFDLDILDGEEIFIDFGRGKVESTVRGDLIYTVKPGSDLRAFTMLPGENKIVALMIDDVDAKMTLAYTPQHWSADATQRGEEL